MSPYLPLLLLLLACAPLAAQTSASDPQQQWPLLQERLAIVDAAAGEGDAAALERLQARQALQALPELRSRDRAFATGIAALRVSTAETALKVAQLRQLHFEFAFVATGALRKDIEDQRIAVEHAQAREFLEVAFLARRERMIDEDDLGAELCRGLTDLLSLIVAQPLRARAKDHGRGCESLSWRLDLDSHQVNFC